MECGRCETGAVDWEVWKEMVVAGSESVSEGNTMASNGCGWNPARDGAGERDRGGTRVQARKVRVGAKTRGVWP